MAQIFYVFVILFSLILGIHGVVFKQERAKVVYVNPKYLKDVTTFTYRDNRHSTYLTSLNMTTLVPFTNNATFRFEFSNPKFEAYPLRLDLKLCDAWGLKWAVDFMHTYSDVPQTCPLPANSYHVNRFEIPPKNFPMKFNNFDYDVKTTVFATDTEELILEVIMGLKYGNRG